MLVSDLCDILQVTPVQGGETSAIHKLVYDSRRISGSADELFVALKGQSNDGHHYIPSVYQKGCRNFLISSDIDFEGLVGANLIKVDDTLAAMQQLAAAHRSTFHIPVIGITGSNGKTIVKEWLATLLAESSHVIKSPKSYNSQLGVPLSVWEMNHTHEVAIFEAGISQSGEMTHLQEIIQPTMGIFTNLGEAHNSGFNDQSEKLLEKALLFQKSSQNIARLRYDDIVSVLSEKPGELVTWELNNPQATINITSEEKQFTFEFRGKKSRFHLKMKNAFDLENIFHAISAAFVFGLSEGQIQSGLDKIKAIPMRLELKRGLNDSYILDDSYNNDLLGLGIALDYLLQHPKKQGKVVVLSDILQSGKTNEELYREVNDLLLKHQIDHLIGIGTEINKASSQFSMRFSGYESTASFIRSAPQFANQMILVKGARDFHLEQVVRYLEDKSHGTVLEVNYEAIIHNLNTYRARLNSSTKLMVMVKAFAYGVGVDEIAHLLQYHQVDYLGVAYLDEAINLRRKGIETPVMIMNVDWDSFALVETFGLEPEIYSIPMLKRYLETCISPPPIHLKIETGMNRLGFAESEIPELIALLQDHPDLKVAGVFTHFSSAEEENEDNFTKEQARRFEKISAQISSHLGYQPIKHAVNSAGIVRWPQYHYDMVRLGIGMYGFDSTHSSISLKPNSILKTKISQIKQISNQDSIGYNRKGRLEKGGEIAVVSIGYADGYSRAFGNGKAYMLIHGEKAFTIGNVCMDMTMLDVTGLDVKEGDEVIVFGANPTIQQLAQWTGTIPYEILTNVSQRVKRVFVSE
ncbi:MAG: bifunctional UDP-N-acetylmuramoyl-tripeptide:D-alanyl-D-alanine ligase/alanine racemase [Cyclobacteriaceae bacterium]